MFRDISLKIFKCYFRIRHNEKTEVNDTNTIALSSFIYLLNIIIFLVH